MYKRQELQSKLISNPELWTPETLILYKVVTSLVDTKTRKAIDEKSHKVGFLSLIHILMIITFGFAYNSVQSNTICLAWQKAFGIEPEMCIRDRERTADLLMKRMKR